MVQVEHIEVTVGQLPEWYVEQEHDNCLEELIERHWHSNASYAEAAVEINYSYSGPGFVRAYDEESNTVFERDTDLEPLFQAVYGLMEAPYRDNDPGAGDKEYCPECGQLRTLGAERSCPT